MRLIVAFLFLIVPACAIRLFPVWVDMYAYTAMKENFTIRKRTESKFLPA
jgi:hypothetical protein